MLDETVTQYIADKLPPEYATNPADHYRHEKIKQFLASLDDDKSPLFGIKAEHKDAIKQQLSYHSNAQTNYAVDNVQQVNRLIEGYSGLNGNPKIPTIPVDYDVNIKQSHLRMLNGGYDSYNMGMDLRKTPVFAEADDVLSKHRNTVTNLELEIENGKRQYLQMVAHNKTVDVHEQKMAKLKQLHQEFDSVKSVTIEHPELQTEIAKKTTASIAEIDAKIAKTTKTVGEKGLGKAWTNNADELTKAHFTDLAEHTKGARTWGAVAGGTMAILGTGLTLWQLSESGKAEQASKERQAKLAELRKMDVQA